MESPSSNTFLMHEYSSCPKCTKVIEVQVVRRGMDLVHLCTCPKCGPSETTVSHNAADYMDDLIQTALSKAKSGDESFFKKTTATCPMCMKLLPVDVVFRDGRVYFKRNCDVCGPSEALVAEDAENYVNAYTFARAGSGWSEYAAGETKRVSPMDYGLVKGHEQHS